MPERSRENQGLPFLWIFTVVALLAFAVAFPLIKPLAWSVLLSFSIYPFNIPSLPEDEIRSLPQAV